MPPSVVPFTQGSFDRSGVGLGLSFGRRIVESNPGSLTVLDVPGKGCVFAMGLVRQRLP
jgi:signal transduction histidine kinase